MVEITYHKEGDYFIPDFYLEKEDYEKDYNIGKYGHLKFICTKKSTILILIDFCIYLFYKSSNRNVVGACNGN